MCGAVDPMSTADIKALDPDKHEVNGSFAISHLAAEKYVMNLDLWVCKNMQSLTKVQRETVVTAVARMYILAISSIHTLTQTAEATPLVTPKELVATTLVELSATIDSNRDRVVQNYGEAGIDKIGQEFKRLCRDYDTKKPIAAKIDSFDHRLASFKEMWQLGDAATLYPTLASFCGGLATVFPNTATVEADFSLIGCAKTDKITSLTDLALEGILHGSVCLL
ncbi:hypothetical protein PI124_g18993 [Phytophthora idaei]|nr:hypothetical protein PI125_g19793 [Phytophthora idaei]KAG3135479.1 hypothetical protein PI126_g18233 [Phytophthora idaei]KAG3235985.1 hypothetical protein PI124_g18993 [Phytophthora idaei]